MQNLGPSFLTPDTDVLWPWQRTCLLPLDKQLQQQTAPLRQCVVIAKAASQAGCTGCLAQHRQSLQTFAPSISSLMLHIICKA
jgi:hypothetical protein